MTPQAKNPLSHQFGVCQGRAGRSLITIKFGIAKKGHGSRGL